MSGDEISVSVIETIGDTPLVALDRLTADLDGCILGKLEYFNPGFSKKDRAAREIITEAEAAGQLLPGQVVVEPEGAEAIADGSTDHPDHPIQGGGYSMSQLCFLKQAEIDGYLKVSGDQAHLTARQLAREEGGLRGIFRRGQCRGCGRIATGSGSRRGCCSFDMR